MMKFALLCSGSKGNSFLLSDEATHILVDCGGPKAYFLDSLAKLSLSIEDLDAVLLTHTHTDHTAQLKLLKERPLYAPVEIPYPFHAVKAERDFMIGHITVLPIRLSHDAPQTTGYVFSTWQEKLVYITDTGFVREKYMDLLRGADYIILESNHDIQMLMKTDRPQFLKARIAGDEGHLCNEDCAAILKRIVTERTKTVVLAHLSQQANTRERALQVCRNALLGIGNKNAGLRLAAAGQFEMIRGGADEKMDLGSCWCTFGMESDIDDTAHAAAKLGYGGGTDADGCGR